MKISEMIELLQKEKERLGDTRVILVGHYGSLSETFEVIEDRDIPKKDRKFLHIWTDISTG